MSSQGHSTTQRQGPAHDLLSGGADLLDIGVLAARSSAAAKRIATGQALDDVDRDSLEKLAALLESAAQVVEFFGTGGQQGVPPGGALAAQVDVVIDTATFEVGEPTDTANLATSLRSFAEEAQRFARGEKPAGPSRAIKFFEDLALSILRETGHTGERTSIL